MSINIPETNICYSNESPAQNRKTSTYSYTYKFEEEEYLQIADRIKRNSKNGYNNNRYVHLFLNSSKNARNGAEEIIFKKKNEGHNKNESQYEEFWKTENYDDLEEGKEEGKEDGQSQTNRECDSRVMVSRLY